MRITFSKFAWGVLVYNLLVILWGAYVRATGSGAGCGAHWPLCQGEVIPRSAQVGTLIEFTHRLMSGLVLVLAVIMVIWALGTYSKGSLIRRAVIFVGVFTLTEALLGAGLVLFELTAENDSVFRAVAIMLHLVNTFLLLAANGLTAWWASNGAPERLSLRGRKAGFLFIGLIGLLVTGATGAVTALGDTLFPATSFAEGFARDFSSTEHFLIRLRVIHPIAAVVVAGLLLSIAGWVRSWTIDEKTRRVSWGLTGIVLLQIALGALNVLLAAPVWMQLVHLLVADLTWIAMIWLTALSASQIVYEPHLVSISA